MDSMLEAFKVYLREYLCKNESEIKAEMGKLLHCHELVVNTKQVSDMCVLEEEWRPIEGYEGLYEISSWGRIKSFHNSHSLRDKRSHIIRLNKMKHGRFGVFLYKNGKHKRFLVHRLVAQTFIPNPNNYPQVEGLTHDYIPWLTPDQARRAVEIAREEMIEKACHGYCDDMCEKGMCGMCYHKHDGKGQVKNTFKYNECYALQMLINSMKDEVMYAKR